MLFYAVTFESNYPTTIYYTTQCPPLLQYYIIYTYYNYLEEMIPLELLSCSTIVYENVVGDFP